MLTDINHPNTYLKFDINDHIYINVNNKQIPMHMYHEDDYLVCAKYEEIKVNSLRFDRVILEIQSKLSHINKVLAAEIRERFIRDDFLESMSVFHPLFWNQYNGLQHINITFQRNMEIFISHFNKLVEINGIQIDGILNKDLLLRKFYNFGLAMLA